MAVDDAVEFVLELETKPAGLVDVMMHVAEILDRLELEEFFEALSNGTHWLTVSLSDPIGKFQGRLIQSFSDLIDLGRAAGQYI